MKLARYAVQTTFDGAELGFDVVIEDLMDNSINTVSITKVIGNDNVVDFMDFLPKKAPAVEFAIAA